VGEVGEVHEAVASDEPQTELGGADGPRLSWFTGYRGRTRTWGALFQRAKQRCSGRLALRTMTNRADHGEGGGDSVTPSWFGKEHTSNWRTNVSEPLDIVGVIEDEVGTPRNDGTAGSALYAVPIRLSRVPDALESRLLVQVWDRPPTWSTMHRPGISRVSGDRLILDGTTIDEVAQVHAKTLRLVVDKVNELAAEQRRRDQVEQERRDAERTAHQEHVSDTARDIEF